MITELIHSKQVGRDKLMDFDRCEIMLKDVKKVLDKHDIRFFLMFGTLLGAIRENDFIWYDNDMDIGILWEDLGKIQNTIKDFQDLGYTVLLGEYIKDYIIFRYIHIAPYHEKVDMVTLIPYKEYYVWARSAHVFNQGLKIEQAKYVLLPFPKKHFEKFDTIKFKGEDFLVPHLAEELLTYQFKTWRIPGNAQMSLGLDNIIIDIDEFRNGLPYDKITV